MRLIIPLISVAVLALSSGCGGADVKAAKPASTGSITPKACPAGTVAHGAVPPKGTMVWCSTKGAAATDKRARTGPFVNWACAGCENGAAQTGQLRNGVPVGTWVLRASDGKAIESGNYTGGKRNGRWQGWHPDGNNRYDVGYDEDGKPHGAATYWWKTGKQKTAGTWNHGTKTGSWKEWTRKGVLKSSGPYDGTTKTGKWTFFKPDGTVDRYAWYLVGSITKEGRINKDGSVTVTAFAIGGVKKAEWTERKGKKHGEEVHYHAGTKVVASKTTWADGVANGAASWHREDGSVIAKGAMAKGKRLCGWRYFDTEGSETTARAKYAKQAAAGAAAAKVPADPCKWTIDHAVAIREAGDASVTVAVARWLLEHTVESAANAKLSREPPGEDARLAAVKVLIGRAKVAIKAANWRTAALYHAAAVLAIDDAMSGKLLERDTGAGDAVGSSDPDAFKTIAVDQLESIRTLLWATEGGEKAHRKSARVTLGRVGVDKIAMRKLVKRLK